MAQVAKGPGISGLLRKAAADAKAQFDTASLVISGDADSALTPPVARAPHIFGVLDYIEQPWGIGMKLYPVQRFIVKLYYHIPLDDTEKCIEITDMFNSRVLYHFTEKEYLRFLYEEGRCNIGEQDHERRELLLSIGRRAGKCITGDSLVLTSRGIFPLSTLGEANEDASTPVALGVVQEGGRRSSASAFYNGGVKATFKVKTKSGYTITGTGNHRVKVMGSSGCVEWRYLDEIKPGECLALNRSTDLWATEELDLRPYHNTDGRKDVELPEKLDERWGNLLGYLVGDGIWGDQHAVSVTVEHPETWEYLRGLFSALLGEPRLQMDERTENTGRLEFCSVRARRFLDALGWELTCARDAKMIPWAILRSSKQVVCAFLRGLFETDGCAEGGGRHITLSSASFRLAHEVQVLLLNLGIVSNVHRKWVPSTGKHYAVLSIKGVRSRRVFASLVGFDSEKKRLPMLAALESAQEGKSDTESIPNQLGAVRDWLESIPKRNSRRGELGWRRSHLRAALGNACKPSGEDLTYPRLLAALPIAKELGAGQQETTHFEELLRLDYFYDPVATVEESEDPVYDLTVPDGESFVANGVTNHNTTLSGIFASYEVYRLLNMHSPQTFYGLPAGNRIQIISVATDKDQAGLLFNEVTTHLSRCEYFKQYIANNTLSYIQFRTPADIEKYGTTIRHENGKFVSFNGKATLRVTFKSCIAKGLRGAGNIVVILDEMAHFKDKGQSSSREIYDAVTPSTAAFSPKDPSDASKPIGPVESRIICISSPLNRQGKFYEIYHQAMSRGLGSENILAIQAPTWEVNPTIPASYYRQKYHADPSVFMTEHGAQFSDRVRGWIEREEDLRACLDASLRPQERGLPRYPHSMGIDIGLVGDGTAVVITAVDDDRVVLVYHEHWVAGTDWKVTNPHLGNAYPCPYARNIQNVERLDFEEIAAWIVSLTQRFYIVDGLFDRWNGIPLEQSLQKQGLNQFSSEFFTRDFNSRIYQNTKLMMLDRKLVLYDYPLGEQGKNSPLVQELLTLQATQMSKNVVVVEAPEQQGFHDDMSDALVRSVWLSTQRMTSPKRLRGAGGSGYYASAASMVRYHLQRTRTHGVLTDRRVGRAGKPFLRGR